MELNLKSRAKSFGGWTEFYSHQSKETGTVMHFSVYVPPQAQTAKVPVLYWLSGLTCNEEIFMYKAGAQRLASELGILLVAPDTSPRGVSLPGDSESWDFGIGAGFYVDATEAPWAKHYRMYSYVSSELPAVLREHFPINAKESIMGHSMGGHGALVLALRQPGRYRSVSAFAPICAPTLVPWGQKALPKYLGANEAAWAKYDAHLLVKQMQTGPKQELFVDQGTEDKFLKDQLWTEKLETACREANHPLKLRYQQGYDHSYYFIASFMAEHVRYHARHLTAE
jgi:S-formylglutathione hydrolase